MRRILEIGGLVAAAILMAFGIASITMGALGRSTVATNLKQEQIVGSPDMNPKAIKGEAAAAGLKNVTLPTCSVANVTINNGTRARCFAEYMRIHALESTGGVVYANLPRYATTDGKGTNDAAKAMKSATGQLVDYPGRTTWITELALTGSLNMSYMAEQVALFSVVVGVALLLAGVGFGVLAVGGALRNPETAIKFLRRKTGSSAIPAA